MKVIANPVEKARESARDRLRDRFAEPPTNPTTRGIMATLQGPTLVAMPPIKTSK
jgi:hypothetical protein